MLCTNVKLVIMSIACQWDPHNYSSSLLVLIIEINVIRISTLHRVSYYVRAIIGVSENIDMNCIKLHSLPFLPYFRTTSSLNVVSKLVSFDDDLHVYGRFV